MHRFANHLARIATAILAGCLLAAAAPAAAQQDAAPGRAEIERTVRQYLLEHPEVIIEALDAYKRRQEKAEEEAAAAAVASRRSEIFADPETPVGGNPKGDVTLVEFFDYRCPVCKRVHPLVEKLVAGDSGLRRVYKDWPILGPDSVFAARAALAARAQGKYLAFNKALMRSRTKLTPAAVMLIAKNVGLDTERLRRDMKAPEIQEILKRNFRLAEALKLKGTPSFVIGDTVVRGARDLDSLRALVAEARQRKTE